MGLAKNFFPTTFSAITNDVYAPSPPTLAPGHLLWHLAPSILDQGQVLSRFIVIKVDI